MTLVSEDVLVDTILSLGLMICFYYGLTAFAAAWYFRRESVRSVKQFLLKGVGPVLGGLTLAAVFVKLAVDAKDPAYGSGGVDLRARHRCSCSAWARCCLGSWCMFAWQARSPAFFRGETLQEGHARAGGRRVSERHPLDPLTADEFRAAVAVVLRPRPGRRTSGGGSAAIERGGRPRTSLSLLLPWRPDPPREARVTGRQPATRHRPTRPSSPSPATPCPWDRGARRAGQHDAEEEQRTRAHEALIAHNPDWSSRPWARLRDHRPRPGPDRHLGLRHLLIPLKSQPEPPNRLDRRLRGPVHAVGQPVRPPSRPACTSWWT